MLKRFIFFWACLTPFFVSAADYCYDITSYVMPYERFDDYLPTSESFDVTLNETTKADIVDQVLGSYSSSVYDSDAEYTFTLSDCSSTSVATYSSSLGSGSISGSCTYSWTDANNNSGSTSKSIKFYYEQGTCAVDDSDSTETVTCDDFYSEGQLYYVSQDYSDVDSYYSSNSSSLSGHTSCVQTLQQEDGSWLSCSFSTSTEYDHYTDAGDPGDDLGVWLASSYTGSSCTTSDSEEAGTDPDSDGDVWTGSDGGQCFTNDSGGQNCYDSTGTYVPDTDPDHPDNGGNLDGDSTNDPESTVVGSDDDSADDTITTGTGGDDSGTTSDDENSTGSDIGEETCDPETDLDCTGDDEDSDNTDGSGGEGDGTCEGEDCCDEESLLECTEWDFGDSEDHMTEHETQLESLTEAYEILEEKVNSATDGDGYFEHADLLESSENWINGGYGSLFSLTCSNYVIDFPDKPITLYCDDFEIFREGLKWLLYMALVYFAYVTVVETAEKIAT